MARADGSALMYHGLTKDMINFPRELINLEYDLDFADEDDEVANLTFEQCKNFIDSICGIGNLLVEKGAVKYKLTDARVEGSEWSKNYRNLVNGARRQGATTSTATCGSTSPNNSQDSDDLSEPQPSTSFKASVRSSLRISAAAKRQAPARKNVETKKRRTPPVSTVVANLPALFVMLKEIRKLGYGMFRIKNHTPQQAVKIIPQLRGITMGQLEDFYGSVFGECLENDIESQREFTRRYHRILESLPADPAGVLFGTNPKACGLLIPYIHSFKNTQINHDEDVTGLEMDRIEGALLHYRAGRSKGQTIGRVTGINNAMLFFGVSGSPFGEHVEDGNAYGSNNYLIRGILKFWKIVLSKYCADVRRNVQLVLKKLIKEGLEEDLKKEADQIILSPAFYNNCTPQPIPYKIFMQRRSELMVIGSGVHHGGASAGIVGTIGRATNIITPDYHLAFPIGLKQCDGHGIYRDRFILSDEDIELFRSASIELFNRGVQKELERAVSDAIENFRRVHICQIGSVAQIEPKPTSSSNIARDQVTSNLNESACDISQRDQLEMT